MAEESVLAGAIQMLQNMGFFDILLPFLLVFAIVYGILEKTGIFGEKRHDINAVIALVIGLMVAVTTFVVNILTGFLPLVGLLAVIIVMFLMLVSMFFGEAKGVWDNRWIKIGAVFFVIIIMAIILIDLLGLGELFTQAAAATGGGVALAEWGALIAIGIIIGIIILMSKSSTKSSE